MSQRILFFFAGTLLLHAQQLAITHVTVVDVVRGQLRPDTTVIIRGNEIAELAAAGRIKVPAKTRILDGRGKFLIPGLWDMHVHLSARVDSDPALARTFFGPLFVVNGITGVRDAMGRLTQAGELKAGMRLGEPVPRVFTAGLGLDGGRPMFAFQSIACANAEQGRKAVQQQKRDGVDFIKVYERLELDTFLAIASEAKTVGLPFAGHVPRAVTAVEASEAGQKSIEHLSGIFLSCSSREAELRRELAKPGSNRGPVDGMAARSYDSEKAAALFSTFIRNSTWQVPTLVSHQARALTGEPDFMQNLRWGAFKGNPVWDSAQPWPKGWPPSDRRAFLRSHIELVGAMHRAGVKILAGTDAPNPFVYPGDSLHEELALLVDAGLSPLDALRSATSGPAEYFGVAGTLGSVAPGKLADLLVLDGNPLVDITNTKRIAAVILNGRLYAKEELKRIRASAEMLAP